MARNLSLFHGNPILLHISGRSNPSRPCSLVLPIHRRMKIANAISCEQSYWATINSDIEAYLKQAIPVREPFSVSEPMYHLTFTTQQSTAPALCVAACELVGGHRDQALPAASALHLMYASSFIHEHLPLTQSPRPKSMVQHAYDPNIELLIGDAMIPLGLELLAKSDDPDQNNSGKVVRVMAEITRVIGSQGMVYGQWCDVERYQSGKKMSSHIKNIEHICEKYEGEFHACAAACGAILGGGQEEEIERMRSYGIYIGKIQGMSRRFGSHDDMVLKKFVEELTNLASKELRGFNEAKIEALSNFITYTQYKDLMCGENGA